MITNLLFKDNEKIIKKILELSYEYNIGTTTTIYQDFTD